MARCIYCNEKAGFLKFKHKECKLKNEEGRNLISKKSSRFFNRPDYSNDYKEITKIASNAFISKSEMNELLGKVYVTFVEKYTESGKLSLQNEDKLNNFTKDYKLPEDVLIENDAIGKVIRASILRELEADGDIFNRINISSGLPFKFQKNEKLIYLFEDVEFHEQRVKTHYEGGSDGFSMRIAKGLYYRKSAFRGQAVKTEQMEYIAEGILAFTNKHLYFSSPSKNFRINYNKIITLNEYSDGIGIQKDGVTAKPQIFTNIDGWFCYNFLMNINN